MLAEILKVTSVYAGVFGIFLVILTIITIRQRVKSKAKIGDNDDVKMRYVIRAHGNFAEYVPLILILLAINELRGLPHIFLHITAALAMLGRILHAYSLITAEHSEKPTIKFRQAGMALTITPIILFSLAAIFW